MLESYIHRSSGLLALEPVPVTFLKLVFPPQFAFRPFGAEQLYLQGDVRLLLVISAAARI